VKFDDSAAVRTARPGLPESYRKVWAMISEPLGGELDGFSSPVASDQGAYALMVAPDALTATNRNGMAVGSAKVGVGNVLTNIDHLRTHPNLVN